MGKRDWHSCGIDSEDCHLWVLYTINVDQAVQHHVPIDGNLNKETFASMVGCFEEAVYRMWPA